jgi:two-component sensor histidine kinase
MAIERERHEQSLKAAVARHEVLLKEINHRVKNSLALVVSMLRLQARDDDDPKVTERLEEASTRIIAVARAHDRLYQSNDVEKLDIGVYVEQVCRDMNDAVSQLDVQINAEQGIAIATDRAIASALIVSEVLTNAAKYAYKVQPSGKIWVTIARAPPNNVVLSVRDEGSGLPDGFDPRSAKSLGMRIITAFSRQINGQLAVKSSPAGAEFVLTMPIDINT